MNLTYFDDPFTFALAPQQRWHFRFSTITGWIAVKFGSDVDVARSINPNDSGDPLMTDQNGHMSGEISANVYKYLSEL